MSPFVELIYDADCPNAAAARNTLRQALAAAGLEPKWQEWERAASDAPPYTKVYGSPTILVNGRDVAGAPPQDGAASCRVYGRTGGGLARVPSVAAILAVLRNPPVAGRTGAGRSGGRDWISSFAALPGLGAALLPVGACPACWPLYAGLLSVMGLGFLLETRYLLPLTAGLLLLAAGALAYGATRRRGYGPFLLGLLGAAVLLAGKFLLSAGFLTVSGFVLLLAASAWNAWPTKKTAASCPACCASPGAAPPDPGGAEKEGDV